MLSSQKMMSAPSGGANYIDDVFSTYLYYNNGSNSVAVNNGIDLSTKGGLVWLKNRETTNNHKLVDTARGYANSLISNLTNAEIADDDLTSFNTNGFTAAAKPAGNYASWTFRKQAKFFDVVTYTGTGSARTVSHNLGSTPGCIIVKRTDASGSWFVYHRGLLSPNDYYLLLNSTAVQANSTTVWNNTAPTSTVFSLGASTATNANGGTYVAYLFAHDAGGFGTAGTDNAISCGSWDSDGSFKNIELGYEPQFILFKKANESSDNWFIADDMRTWCAPPTDSNLANTLSPDSSAAEVAGNIQIYKTATGFITPDYGSGRKYIYIAIRRPMKPPTTGTEVFNTAFGQTTAPGFQPNIVTDSYFMFYKPGDGTYPRSSARLIGNNNLQTSSYAAQNTDAEIKWDYQNGTYVGGALDSTFVAECFKRAPGFHDVVCYSGNSTVNTQIPHNLAAAPELVIIKNRTDVSDWLVWNKDAGHTSIMLLDTNGGGASYGMFNDTDPTSSYLNLSDSNVNVSGYNYVAYLFATLPGVSKVGSYTGTGSTQQIDCGFTGGARFVLIKRTDSTGDWYVWDTARGIVSGNDPYLRLNSTAAEVTSTDYIDPYSAGFEISSTAPAAINANGGSFIFLAIA